MKKHLSTIILIVIFLVGLSLLLYPSFSDWWNSFHQSRAVATYVESMTSMGNEEYERMLKEAEEYNTKLAKQERLRLRLTEEEKAEYNSLMDVSGTGIMGYVDIPEIHVKLPIYHGTDDAVLQIAIGHIEGTSLPVGGVSTHTVISGHRGLPSSRLFTDLDRLVLGDTFTLNVMDKVLTYEVDQIRIVLPEEVDELSITQGMDYCTLLTCTPYGINSHRLLVRGKRVMTKFVANVRVKADALQISTTVVAIFIAVPLLLILTIVIMISSGVRRRRKRNNKLALNEVM